MHNSLSNVDRCPAGGRRTARRCCKAVIKLVSRQKNVAAELLTDRRRGRLPIARARQLAMYLSHVVLRRTLLEIGEAFGRDRTTVSYACALIEDLRDDPRFDDEVTALEQQLEARMLRVEVLAHAA